MKLRKHGLKALGLSFIAALSLMALTAAGAQAAGEWKIETKTMTELGLTEEAIKGKLETGVKNILLVKTLNVNISCAAVDTSANAKILKGGTLTGSLIFLTCKVFADEAGEPELTACGTKSTGAAAGEIQTVAVTGEIILSGGENFVLVKPVSGTTFTTVELTGASCAAKGTYPITGTTVVKLGVEAKELLLTPIKEFTGDGLKFGENKAFLFGAAIAELNGAKLTKIWTGF